MNERIKELYSQAGLTINNPLAYEQWYLDALEKFAELIVRECISIGRETSKEIFKMSKKEGDIFEYESHGAEQVIDNIKEHFGIKE